MSDLTPETRSLLDRARDGDNLPPARRALLETKLFTRIAGGAALGLAAREAWAKSTGLFGPVAKGVAGLALVSSIGGGGYLAVHALRYDAPIARTTPEAPPGANPPSVWSTPAEPTPVAPSRAARGSAVATETPRRARDAPAAVAARERASTAPKPTEPTAPAEEAGSVRAPSTLADETRLLWEADQAVRAGNSARALALLDEHASRYPDGALGPERAAERVVALCNMGRVDAATVRAYLVSHPNSSLNDRIQQTCARILSRAR